MSLELAIKHAKENTIEPKGRNSISRFGCVITDGTRVFRGHNSYKTHPLQAKFAAKAGNPAQIHIHAEVAALVKAARSGIVPGKAKVYVARVLGDGTPANARPCAGCMMALSAFGFTDVTWT